MDLDTYLAAIAAGDPHAFGRWVAGAERPVRASLRPLAAIVDTEAVLQETLLRMWQVAPRVVADGQPNGLLRLALRTARNLALSELRRARVAGIDPAELERAMERAGEVSVCAPPDPLLRDVIAGCRDALPAKPAEALSARLESAGAARDEALAAGLGMRLNTFLQNVTRAKKLLLDCLRGKGVALEELT
jgi:RNA polymerase sigma-70 factor (ECF subfamily)